MKQEFLTRKAVIAFLAFICCALWGSAIPMIKTGYAILGVASSDAATQVLFGGLRFLIAGILVLIFACIQERRVILPDKNVLKYAPILCMAQTVGQYFFFYIGVANSNGVTGGILTGMGNFFAIIMSCMIFRSEKITARKTIGCLFGFAGIIMVNLLGGNEAGGFKLIGEGFVLFSGLCYGLSSSLIKNFSKKASAVLLSGWQFFIGGVILVLIGLLMGGSLHGFNTAALAVLLYLAFVSAVAYTLWSILLEYNPVSQVSIFGFINPICSVILSALILGEVEQAFSIGNLLALLLVSVGIFVVNKAPKYN